MDYFITLNEKSIDAIGEAVEKPITVIEGLKETLAETIQEKDAIIVQKDEIIADKDEEIEGLEDALDDASKASTHTIRIMNVVNNGNLGDGQVLVLSSGRTVQGGLSSGMLLATKTQAGNATGHIDMYIPNCMVDKPIGLEIMSKGVSRVATISRNGFTNNTSITKSIVPVESSQYENLGTIDKTVTLHTITLTL